MIALVQIGFKYQTEISKCQSKIEKFQIRINKFQIRTRIFQMYTYVQLSYKEQYIYITYDVNLKLKFD